MNSLFTATKGDGECDRCVKEKACVIFQAGEELDGDEIWLCKECIEAIMNELW